MGNLPHPWLKRNPLAAHLPCAPFDRPGKIFDAMYLCFMKSWSIFLESHNNRDGKEERVGYQFLMYGLFSTVFVGSMAHISGESILVPILLVAYLYLTLYALATIHKAVTDMRDSLLTKARKRMNDKIESDVAKGRVSK